MAPLSGVITEMKKPITTISMHITRAEIPAQEIIQEPVQIQKDCILIFEIMSFITGQGVRQAITRIKTR